MMSVDPEYRPKASECLKHKAFDLIPKEEPEIINQQTQKRSSVILKEYLKLGMRILPTMCAHISHCYAQQ